MHHGAVKCRCRFGYCTSLLVVFVVVAGAVRAKVERSLVKQNPSIAKVEKLSSAHALTAQ